VDATFLKRWCILFSVLFFSFTAQARQNDGLSQSATVSVSHLPAEARQTLDLIRQGGPFPYAKDGVVFGNYERILPKQPRGYYHEYTVPTPRQRGRGAQRLIVGGQPVASGEYYYTPDHYRTFLRITQ
jgi:ribonuclease T1